MRDASRQVGVEFHVGEHDLLPICSAVPLDARDAPYQALRAVATGDVVIYTVFQF
jgi:hypothetical protein